MTMIERVAARLEKSFQDAVAASAGTEFERTGVTSPAQAVWLRYAGEAIVEMREPTEEILDAYWHQAGESKEMRSRTHAYATRYYGAMIDAAIGG